MEKIIQTPDSRKEFEHNIFLVYEDALQKIKSKNETAIGSLRVFTLPSLEKVSPLPNGRVSLLTIDERIRLQANTLNQLGIRVEQ